MGLTTSLAEKMPRLVQRRIYGTVHAARTRHLGESYDTTVALWWVVWLLAFFLDWAKRIVGHELTHQVQATRPDDPIHKTGGHHPDSHGCAMRAKGRSKTWLHLEVAPSQVRQFILHGSVLVG